MAEKRRVGRPRVRHDDAPGEYVGFRAPRALKEKLETAAEVAGRSLSTEAQFRLQESFRDDEQLPASLKRIYGPQLAGLLLLIGEILRDAGRVAGFKSTGTLRGADEWFDEPKAFNQATEEIKIIIEALRPLNFVENQSGAEGYAIQFLLALADPSTHAISRRLEDLANELRPMFGHAVNRIYQNFDRIRKEGNQ